MAEEMIRAREDLRDSDRELVLAIRRVLWDYEPLRATRTVLDVEVDDGRVRLSGRMRTQAMKEVAEYKVVRLPNVRAVRNDVLADPEVVRAVADALAADDRLAPACIRVEVRNGDVTLSGAVADEALIRRAQDVAARAPGVERVESRLVVEADGSASANGIAVTEPVDSTGEQWPVDASAGDDAPGAAASESSSA